MYKREVNAVLPPTVSTVGFCAAVCMRKKPLLALLLLLSCNTASANYIAQPSELHISADHICRADIGFVTLVAERIYKETGKFADKDAIIEGIRSHNIFIDDEFYEIAERDMATYSNDDYLAISYPCNMVSVLKSGNGNLTLAQEKEILSNVGLSPDAEIVVRHVTK